MQAETAPIAAELIGLFHHRWTVPILAELGRSGGAKFVTLYRRLHMSRDSLGRTLTALIERRLIARNPGYGHPMRPEYILTPIGRRLAPDCDRLRTLATGVDLEEVTLRKWSMPVLLALGSGADRFTHLRTALPGATARALTLALKELETSGLLARRVTDAHPPHVRYRLERRGRRLVAPVVAMQTTLR